jgi:arylsulfatase A-like enzyme
MPTYVQTLKQAGYRCGLTYKTGISPESSVPFDFRPSYKQNRLTGKDGPALVNNSIDNFRFFLSQLQANTPFYFQAQTPDTHSGWDRPEFIQPGSEGWPYPDVDPSRIQGFPSFGDDFVMDQPFARVLASYYRAIQRVDWYVGHLLALLEEFGHSRNTLVVFTADHGPSHILRGKTTPYENGLRVPFIARWPGTIPPGTRSEALVSFVDLAPTFMEVAGLRPPGYLPGYSLVPVFRGQPSERDCLYSAYNGHTTGEGSYWPTRTITDGRFKLIHNLNGDGRTRRIAQGYYNTHHAMARILDRLPPDSTARRVAERSMAPPEFELYDLELDPGEIQNLAGQPDDHEIERDLRDRLWTWRTEVVRDPFCDPAYLAGFNDEMAKQVERMEAKREEIGGSNVKGSGWKLDWDHRIPAWDPTPYTRRDCP